MSEVVSLICHRGDVAAVKRTPMHERVPWLEMDHGFVWVKVFWVWQVFAKLVGWGDSKEKQEEERKAKERPRVFFTHLPLELLPKQALEGGCKVSIC